MFIHVCSLTRVSRFPLACTSTGQAVLCVQQISHSAPYNISPCTLAYFRMFLLLENNINFPLGFYANKYSCEKQPFCDVCCEVLKGTSSLFFTCALFEEIKIKENHFVLSQKLGRRTKHLSTCYLNKL